MAPPILLIVAVLGAILGDGATPTEGASAGAAGALLMAGRRQEVARWLILGGATGALLFSMALIFVLGFFLDFVQITVILLPLIMPPLILLGHDPVWLAILIAVNLQTSFLSPPFGFSLFYLRGAAPPEITTGQIYVGVLPFIILQIIGMAVLWLLPPVATWLPGLVF